MRAGDSPSLLPLSPFMSFVLVAGIALATAYLFVASPGLAGDEPAHYENVCFYEAYRTLPVLGHPGVSYEAQMGPVYYALSAMVLGLLKPLGETTAFYALRAMGLLLIPAIMVLSYCIAARVKPGDIEFAETTAAFMTLNPTMLAIASSIQNDYLSILLVMATAFAAYRYFGDSSSPVSKGLKIGALCSAAILTKATALFMVCAVPLYAVLRLKNGLVKFILSFLTTVAGLCSWFFIRNCLLYGDFSAQRALTQFHYNNNPLPTNLLEPAHLRYWLWVMQGYYWAPVQYYRDIFHAPIPMRLAIAAFTVMGCVGIMILLARPVRAFCAGTVSGERSPATDFGIFLFAAYASCLAIYTYSCMRITHFAPRVTFPTIIVYALVIASGAVLLERYGPRSARLYKYSLVILLSVVNAYVLACILPCVLHHENFILLR